MYYDTNCPHLEIAACCIPVCIRYSSGSGKQVLKYDTRQGVARIYKCKQCIEDRKKAEEIARLKKKEENEFLRRENGFVAKDREKANKPSPNINKRKKAKRKAVRLARRRAR